MTIWKATAPMAAIAAAALPPSPASICPVGLPVLDPLEPSDKPPPPQDEAIRLPVQMMGSEVSSSPSGSTRLIGSPTTYEYRLGLSTSPIGSVCANAPR